MITVAALIVTAATFWSAAAPGVAQQTCPDGVRFNVKPAAALVNQGPYVAAESQLGSCVITFRAGWLRQLTVAEKCKLVIHEYGHAALRLEHSPGGIMSPYDWEWRTPGICYALVRQGSSAR